MKRQILVCWLGVVSLAFVSAGCVVRTYPLTKDRIDQDLTIGNRGYLMGKAQVTPERKTTRTTQVVEVEMYPLIRFEKMSKARAQEKAGITPTQDESLEEGNKGYIMQSEIPEVSEPRVSGARAFEKYTVRKNDTLQKISQMFYGTTKKWTKIYEANKEALKGPNKIYVGQVLNIPVEGIEGVKGKLK